MICEYLSIYMNNGNIERVRLSELQYVVPQMRKRKDGSQTRELVI